MSDFMVMARYELALALLRAARIPRAFRQKLDFMRRGIHVARGSVIEPGTKIGNRTRINAASHLGRCEIGSYCAIGGRLVVRSTNHSTDYVNMQGFAQRRFLGCRNKVTGFGSGDVRIGHGVWIGDSAILLPGAEIGNGAVIGAGSVVTKPIPAYAVAAGSPARVIKKRFPQRICDALEATAWWEWDAATIAQNRWLFELDLSSIDEAAALARIEEVVI